MVHWAFFENLLRRSAWEMLDVNPKIGRVAIRDPRIDDRCDMLLEIAHIKKIKLDEVQIASLRSKASETLSWRDLVAHGTWIPHNGRWLVQKVSGQYPKNYEADHRKRRVNPEGIPVDINRLRAITQDINSLMDEVAMIRKAIAEQLPQPPEKRHEG